ncbi:discoidin domain-containing protein [Dactylosporangium sp. NPDC000521]|uniref:discoidin domain-containing protein n=1 Tax=Dactylosporangium sp. NPDC000521 TaxID=3363975 RepID=UPI00367F9D42
MPYVQNARCRGDFHGGAVRGARSCFCFVAALASASAAATCGGTGAALNRPATASPSESGSLLPAKTFDGDRATRWSSAFSGPRWLQVDLGAARRLCRGVLCWGVLCWEAAYARTFALQGSSNGTAWFDLVPAATGTGGTQTLSVAATTAARHVRLTRLIRATRYGYSLFELAAHPAVVPPAAPAAWPTWGGGSGHAGVNVGERTLGAANVETLRRLRLAGVNIEAPVVASGVAYGQAGTLQFAAIDVASGAVRWTTPPATEPALRHTTGGTVGNGLVHAGTRIGFIHAFDAMTGAERWNVEGPGVYGT